MAIQLMQEFDMLQCGECGVAFAVPAIFIRDRRKDHQSWYCPNGHNRYFPAESDEERLKRQLAEEQRTRAALAIELHQQKLALQKQQSEANRLRKRIAAGVCPCCTRSFQNLGRHMKTKHPAYKELPPGKVKQIA